MTPNKLSPVPKWLLKAIRATIPDCPYTPIQLRAILQGASVIHYCPECHEDVIPPQVHQCALREGLRIAAYDPVRVPAYVPTAPSPPAADALTGLLASAVQQHDGRCLCCARDPALYCGLDCAARGR